jgi:RimJ/RimL family protein N-acetyltransferase
VRLESAPHWRDDTVELFLLESRHVGPHYVGWLNDSSMNRFLESRFVTHDESSVRAFVDACLANPDVLFLGVRHLATGRHVGNVKLEISRVHGRAEVGILIGDRELQGQGIATRAIALICRVAREQLGLRKLTAGCYATNKGSERAFNKAGFTVEGTRPDHFLLDGNPEALILMGRVL